jgi:hypothetical protein
MGDTPLFLAAGVMTSGGERFAALRSGRSSQQLRFPGRLQDLAAPSPCTIGDEIG